MQKQGIFEALLCLALLLHWAVYGKSVSESLLCCWACNREVKKKVCRIRVNNTSCRCLTNGQCKAVAHGYGGGSCILIYKNCTEEEGQMFELDINNSVVYVKGLSLFKGNVYLPPAQKLKRF